MSIIPGINNSEEYLKNIINVIIKFIISIIPFIIGIILFFVFKNSILGILGFIIMCVLFVINFYVYSDGMDKELEPYNEQILDFIVHNIL